MLHGGYTKFCTEIKAMDTSSHFRTPLCQWPHNPRKGDTSLESYLALTVLGEEEYFQD